MDAVHWTGCSSSPGRSKAPCGWVTGSGSGEYHDTRVVGDAELRGAVAARARELGRRNPTRRIAADVWDAATAAAAVGRRYGVHGARHAQRSHDPRRTRPA